MRPAPPLDRRAMARAERRWATRAEPPGALGRLETLAVHVCGVTGRCPPEAIDRPTVAVFAADHGAVLDGTSAWPQEVTALMVETMSEGRAAISALAATVGAGVEIVDVGVATEVGHLAGVRPRRVRPGTASIGRGPAMTRDEAVRAVEIGGETADVLIAAGCDCLVGGDMGIGNTTPSAALVGAVTGASADAVCGPGAGLAPERLDAKRRVVAVAIDRASDANDAIGLLAAAGGLEIAALAGFHAAAARARVPFVVDGLIALAALCVADRLAPGTADRAIAGHRSTEPAADIALGHLGLDPLLDLGLRLGEGTGACLAVPLVRAAVAALRDMAELPTTP